MALFRWWTGQNGTKKKRPSSAKDKKACRALSAATTTNATTCQADGCQPNGPSTDAVCAQSPGSQFYESSVSYPVYAFESVRMLLFRENEYRERRLLFDSRAHRERRCSEGNAISTSSQHLRVPAHRYSKSDDADCDDRLEKEHLDHDTVKLLGEMIFGSVSMAVKVDTVKLHQFRSPQMIMLSAIFPCIQPELPEPCAMDRVLSGCNMRDNGELFEYDSDSPSSTFNSADCCNFKNSCTSIPLEIPDKLYRSPKICSPSMRGHSSAPYSFRSEPPAAVGSNASLSSSLKRFNLNQTTSFSVRFGRRLDDGGAESPSPNASRLSRLQLGFCVLFNVDNSGDQQPGNEWFRRFLMLHMQMVEIELTRLRRAILHAYFSKKVFTANVWKAWTTFIGAIRLLYESPRLAHPVWLMQMQPVAEHYRLSLRQTFLRTFVRLADLCDIRESKFFFSTLLTACLMNHLTWVSSVAAAANHHSVADQLPSGQGRLHQWRKNAEGAAHPYNHHLAQLLDVWGVVTSPCRIAHTLILGEKAELVNKILFVLSYFIRCSALEQTRPVGMHWPRWPSLGDVLQQSGNEFVTAVDLDRSRNGLPKSPSTVVRCKSLSSDGVVLDDRHRHCSEIVSTSNNANSRIRCRSGSSLSTDRLLRMSAASCKLPSELSTDSSQSLHSLRATATHGLKVHLSDDLCRPLTIDIASGDDVDDVAICKSGNCNRSPADNGGLAKIDFADVFANSCLERLIRHHHDEPGAKAKPFDCYGQNLGAAMMGSYSPNLCPYFSLAGAPATGDVHETVRDMMKQLAVANIQSPQPIKEAVCVVANTDDWTVRLVSSSAASDKPNCCLVPSKMVSDMVDQARCLYQMQLAGELCLTALEDRLSEVYSKSCALTTLVNENRSNTLDMVKMVRLLDCDFSDIPLLISVATVHSSDMVVSLGVI